MAITITGTVRLPNNTPFANASIIVKRLGNVVAQSSSVMLVDRWTIVTDASGNVNFSIEPGSYIAYANTNLGKIEWSFNVAETPSAQDFETCVEAVTPTITPSLVAQALDAAVAASNAAAQAAVSAGAASDSEIAAEGFASDALAAASVFMLGFQDDARAGLINWQSGFDGAPNTLNNQTGLSLVTGDADFATCIQRVVTTGGFIATRQVYRAKGRRVRVKARIKVLSMSAGTTAGFRVLAWPLNAGFLRQTTVQPVVTTNCDVGQIIEIEETFAAAAGPGVTVANAAMDAWPYARFGVNCTTTGVTIEYLLESLLVEDVTPIERTSHRALSLLGYGDIRPTIEITSGETFDNGSGIVPKVPQAGLFSIENMLRFWPDLGTPDGDYDADMWADGNMYLAASSRIHLRTFIPYLTNPGTDEGRLVIGATVDCNYIQSAKNFSGSVLKDFAIGPYNSTEWWTYYDESLGGWAGFNTASPAARIHARDAGATIALLESNGSTTARLAFRGTSQTDNVTATIGVDSAGRLVMRGTSTDIAKAGSNALQAGADNTISCGSASFRWSVVYAGTGTINTSDERQKTDIRAIDAAELRVAQRLKGLLRAFRWRDAVAEKGDAARIHFGVIAQDVKAAFEAEGLDPWRYAMLCYDEWPDEVEPVWSTRTVTKAVPEVREEITRELVEAADGELKEVTRRREVTDLVQREVEEPYDTGETRLVRPAGDRLGVRYDQLLAFVLAAL